MVFETFSGYAHYSWITGTHDKAEGKVHEVKGAIKEKVGQMTNNPNLQDEGTSEKWNGKVRTRLAT